jgi:hypothetical protein
MRLGREVRGIEGLPVVLLLGAILGASALALGFKAMGRAADTETRQRAIRSFNEFIERAHIVALGGVGSAQQVELELSGAQMLFNGRLVQLVDGDETLRSEVIQLPIVTSVGRLDGGRCSMTLKRATNDELQNNDLVRTFVDNGVLRLEDYFIELRRC